MSRLRRSRAARCSLDEALASLPADCSRSCTASSLAQRIEGGLVGLLVGDALGVPYEFKHPDDLPLEKDIELEPPDWFPRSHATVRPGTWSDDGAQALCLLESLLHRNALDPEDFGRRMVNWLDWGHLAVGGAVFDVGNITARALGQIRDGKSALEAAERHEETNGNGALMRVLPLALWHTGSNEELVRDARLSSLVTHGHTRSQVCCALYCLWARELLAGNDEAWSMAVTNLRTTVRAGARLTVPAVHLARAVRRSCSRVRSIRAANHGKREMVQRALIPVPR
jgi:ADP-ribosyl-[dinitrogen reductase] hydrolase